MQVDGYVQRCGGFQHRQELRLIEEVAHDVRVDYQRVEAELAHGALDFLHGIGGIVRCEYAHAREALRILADGFGQLVVGVDGQRTGLGRREYLHARRGQCQHRMVDAGSIHVGDALSPDVQQTPQDVLRALARARAVETPQAAEARIIETRVAHAAHQGCIQLLGEESFLGGNAQVPRILYHSPTRFMRPCRKGRYLNTPCPIPICTCSSMASAWAWLAAALFPW